MRNKLYWGIATFIVLLIMLGVSAVIFMRTTDTESKVVYIDVEPSKDNPPPAEPGYKWVWHNDRWDKVPVSTTSADKSMKPIYVQTDEIAISDEVVNRNGLSIPDAVALSDDVPQYAELEAMSDDALRTLMYANYDKVAELGPQLNNTMEKWTETREGSDLEKTLRKEMYTIALEYNIAALTSKRAFEVFNHRFIEYNSNIPDHPGKMKIHLPSGRYAKE